MYNWNGKPGPLTTQASSAITITSPLSAAVSTSASNATAGDGVTFTATIAGFDGSPTGSVNFLDGTTVLSTVPVTLVNGVAQAAFTTSQLGVGSHAITAVYTDSNFDSALAPTASIGVAINSPLILPGTTVAATGAAPGSGSLVTVTNPSTGAVLAELTPFNSNFTGGVNVAVGDVNGDGTPDIITAAGAGGGPNVIVYSGRTGAVLFNFMAFDSNFTGGITVAAGDVNGDGFDDIVVGAGAGGGPNVSVFSGKDGSRLTSFFAYDMNFTGGVRVAAGNVMGTDETDVVCGAGPGGGPNVTVFRGTDGAMLASFFAYNPGLSLGIGVTAGPHVGSDAVPIMVTAGGMKPATFTFNLDATGLTGPNDKGESDDGDIKFVGGPDADTLDAFFAADPAHTGSLFVTA